MCWSEFWNQLFFIPTGFLLFSLVFIFFNGSNFLIVTGLLTGLLIVLFTPNLTFGLSVFPSFFPLYGVPLSSNFLTILALAFPVLVLHVGVSIPLSSSYSSSPPGDSLSSHSVTSSALDKLNFCDLKSNVRI